MMNDTPNLQIRSKDNGFEIPPSKTHLLNRTTSTDNLMHVLNDTSRGYVGILEVVHQLHCLDLIRQYTWLLMGGYGSPPGALRSSAVGNRMHVDHCIETLRQTLMCHADVTPLLVRLDPESPTGTRADFSAHHKCRDFERVMAFVDEWADPDVEP
jgi:hypothetical protein